MDAIDSKIVARLRARTGWPILACRTSLVNCGGDEEAAFLELRKRGAVLLSHAPGKPFSNGVCASYIAPDGRSGILLEMNCETDFVARTDEFLQLCRNLGRRLLTSTATGSSEFLDEAPPVGDDLTARQLVAGVALAVGEKLELRRFARYTLGEH